MRNLNDLARALLGVLIFLFVLGILAGIVWFAVFSYKECKAVGHSTLYCALK